MFHFVLDGFWLAGALAAAYLLGVFTAQYAKDTLNGVPSDLRAVLKNVEAKALAALKRSKSNAVADAAAAISAPMPAAVKPVAPPAPPATTAG
jgi:hypothetical protein